MKSFLAIYLPVSFLVVFVWRTLAVWRRTGINPIAFRRGDGVHDYLGRVFIAVEVSIASAIVAFVTGQGGWLGPLPSLDHPSVELAGAVLLVVSTAWAAIAQAQMGASWRIGIDHTHPTTLVTDGLFRFSRNPIFLAMHVALIGFFCALPTVVMLVVLVLGHTLLNVQVRLEEAFLAETHGDRYFLVAPVASAVGILPVGNTGGANVRATKPMPIPPDLQTLLDLDTVA